MFKVTPGGIAWWAPDPGRKARFLDKVKRVLRRVSPASHDCPGAIISRPISYCTHARRLYLWLWVRTRLKMRLVHLGRWEFTLDVGIHHWSKMDEELSRLWQGRYFDAERL